MTCPLAVLKARVANHPKLRTITGKISAYAGTQIVAQAESIYHLAAAVNVELVVKSPIHAETNLHETKVLLKPPHLACQCSWLPPRRFTAKPEGHSAGGRL